MDARLNPHKNSKTGFAYYGTSGTYVRLRY